MTSAALGAPTLDGFSGELLTPESPAYDDARRVANGAIDRRPAFIARARSAEDVAAALGFARRHDLVVAVRGGGHSLPGHSVCDGGLVVDLDDLMATVDGALFVGPTLFNPIRNDLTEGRDEDGQTSDALELHGGIIPPCL